MFIYLVDLIVNANNMNTEIKSFFCLLISM